MSVQAVNTQQAGAKPPAQNDPNYVSPSKAELEDLAKKLHDVGEKAHKKDDYDRRLESLASEFLPTLSDADRGRFIGVVLEKDKGATGSWLQGDRLSKLVDNGRIGADDRQRVLDGVARGYADKNIPQDKAAEFIDTNKNYAPPPADAPTGNKPPAAPSDVLGDGFKEIGPDDKLIYQDIKNVSYPGEYKDGWLRVETSQGDKYAVNPSSAPDAYATAERKYLDLGQTTIDNARDRAGLAPTAETDVFSLETSVEVDGHKLKVGDAAMKAMIDEIKGKDDLFEDSSQAQFLRLIEARSAVSSGKFIHPVYENRHINVGGRTKTETENLLKLEPADMKEMLDEGAINRKLDHLMRDDQVSALYQKSLKEAIDKVPEDKRKDMADRLAKVVESPDYVVEASNLPKHDRPRAQADVEDAISQLGLLDPDRAKQAGQTFAVNALARDVDSTFGDPEAITPEAEVDAVDAGLGAITNAIDKAKLPLEVKNGIEDFLKNGGDEAKRDFAKVAAQMRTDGYAPEDIDKAFADVDFSSDKKQTIRGLVDDLSSNGVLPAVTGAIGITSTVRSLVNDGFGETPEEKLAVAGGLMGMIASLPDTTKLLTNMVKGVDGSALDLLGVSKDVKNNLGVETKYGNQAVSAVGDNVANTDIPETDIPNSDKIVKGLENAAGDAAESSLSRISKSTLKVLSDYNGKAGGVLGVVTGGMDAAAAFSGDSSPAEKAEAVLGVVSGALDLAPDVLKGAGKFISAVGGNAAGAVAERAIGAITRGLGPIGIALTVVSELVSVFVNDAKDKKEAKEQYDWFAKLGEDGVTQGDWNLKYDYAVTTLNSFGNARDYIKNLRELRGADWGGRQAPGDRSIFDFHREEFADFKSKWEKDRDADTYVEFLDPDKREADFKREKDHMDEVDAYMDAHPTYFPGYNDWLLEA
jgi:hypothetical protein